MQDLATQWIQSYPSKTKTSQETQRSLQKFLEPNRKPKVIYTDNSLEFGKACEDLSWNHCTSTPHRSETNGIAERAVRKVTEGTSAVLLQSGLDENWSADFMGCYTNLRNIHRFLVWWEDALWKALWQPFKGPIIPFGSLIEYYPISAKVQSIIHQFGKKVLPGLVSLDTLCTPGRTWKGDILVADIEELETMDASEIYSKRLNAKEVIFPKEKGEFIFSSRRWTNKICWRRSGTENIHLDTGSPNSRRKSKEFFWRIRKSLFLPPQDSLLDAGEAINDFWSMSGNFTIPPSRWTQSQTLLAERRIIPYSTEVHWCIQNYSYKFGCQTRETHRWLLEYRWIQEICLLLEQGFTQFTLLSEKPPDGFLWSWVRLTKRQSRPDHLWPEPWIKLGRNAKLKEKQKWSQIRRRRRRVHESFQSRHKSQKHTYNLLQFGKRWKRTDSNSFGSTERANPRRMSGGD